MQRYGISLIPLVNKKISFNFLYAEDGGFADYVEIHMKGDDFINFTFYKDNKVIR